MIWVLAVAAIAIWATYYTALFLYHSYKLRKFTGPLAFPVVGNLYTAEAFQVLRYMQKMRKVYGDYFVFWGFSKPMLVCTDPVGVREVLSDTKSFIKGADYTYYFAFPFGQGLVTSTTEKHKVDRARLGKYFHKSNVMQYVSAMDAHTKKAMGEFIGDKVLDTTIDFETFFAHLSLRVFGAFCLHHDFSTDVELESRICEIVSKGSFYTGWAIGVGPPMFEFMPYTKAMRAPQKIVMDACRPIIEARRKALAAGEEVPDDPLTKMLEDNLDEQDLTDHLTTLVCAGHDTTAFFCSYTVLLLAQNPDVQEKLREEIISVFGDSNDFTDANFDKLVYLRKVMQEVLRFYPVIPTLTRYSIKEVKIKDSDIVIPEGVTIAMPIISMHRSNTLWDQPEKFDPERWPESTTFRNDPKIGYLPFGYGSRTCIGMSLALTESSIMFCHLLRKYRFTPEPGFRPNIRAGISLTTSNGVKVRVTSL